MAGCDRAGVDDARPPDVVDPARLVDVPAEQQVGLLAVDERAERLAADVLSGAEAVAGGRRTAAREGRRCGRGTPSISARPASARRPSSSSGTSYGVWSGECGAAEAPKKPTPSISTPRPSSETPSSTSRASISGESQLPATARSRGASGRQPLDGALGVVRRPEGRDVAADDEHVDGAGPGDRVADRVEAVVDVDDVRDPHDLVQ